MIFTNGETRFLTTKGYSSDFYEILAEKSFTKENITVFSKIIQKDSAIYLMNLNKRNLEGFLSFSLDFNQRFSGSFIEEVVYLGKPNELSEFLEKFEKTTHKKLLYEGDFLGIDDSEILESVLKGIFFSGISFDLFLCFF